MVKVELDEEGMAAFMTSPEMSEAVLSVAQEIAGSLGAGYETDTKSFSSGHPRTIASVFTTDKKCIRDNLENNTLWKTVKGMGNG